MLIESLVIFAYTRLNFKFAVKDTCFCFLRCLRIKMHIFGLREIIAISRLGGKANLITSRK